MADTVSELLPCPFCGSNDVELRDHGPTLDEGAEICCNNCGARTGKGFGAAHVKKAISAWSTRASTQHAPAFPREEVARIIDPSAWADYDLWAGRLAGKGRWPNDADEVAAIRASCERRMPARVAPSLTSADAIAALLQSKQP